MKNWMNMEHINTSKIDSLKLIDTRLSDRYYELEIFIVQSDLDIQMLKNWKEYSWFSSLNSFKLSSELFHNNILVRFKSIFT